MQTSLGFGLSQHEEPYRRRGVYTAAQGGSARLECQQGPGAALLCWGIPGSGRWGGSTCIAHHWACLSQGRKGELLSPQDLLEGVATTAPKPRSNSQHQHGEMPGFQQQPVCSALASSRAGPWLCSPPARPVRMLPLLPNLGRGFHSVPGYTSRRSNPGAAPVTVPAAAASSQQPCRRVPQDRLCPSLQVLLFPLLWMSAPAAGPSLAQSGATPHGPDQPPR